MSADVEATAGSDGTDALGAAFGGPLGDALGFRTSVQTYENNGFRDNVFLGRDDTYGRDELTARGKLAWAPSDDVQVDFTGLYIDVDNGYDAWAIDNGFNTYSDDPGRDAQQSAAGSVRVRADLARVDLVSITGFADTDAVFSFDADWGNAAYWAPYVYDYVTANDRERRTLSQELRVLSKPGAIAGGRGDWLAGVYVLDLDEGNDQRSTGVYEDPFCGAVCSLATDTAVRSEYDATSFAVFGQVALPMTDRLGVTVGLRWEQRSADYTDTSFNAFSPDDDMLGGELAFDWRLGDRRSAYVRLARGYKAGGFNVSLAGVDFGTIDNVPLSPENIEFGSESLTSIEAGIRTTSADGRLRTDVGAVRRAARRSAGQGAAAAAARRSVVVPVRHGELRARRAPRRRSHGRVADDATARAFGGRRLAARRDRGVLAVPDARGPRASACAGVHVFARRDVPHDVGLVGRASTSRAWTSSSSTTVTINRRRPTASRT